jgi:hypothetical protein
VGNKVGIELQGGQPLINSNNILNNAESNCVIRSVYAEPGREDKKMVYGKKLDFKGNWWGAPEKTMVMESMNIDKDIQVELDPIKTSEIEDAGPDWREFKWLYT